jgi:ATP-dependent exoDNAse (exonuclease V) alpha subunit
MIPTLELTEKQKKFEDLAKSGVNIYLSGKAGTGKSFIIKKIIEYFKEVNHNFIAIAPTGIAANNIGGATIHSTFLVKPYGVASFESCTRVNSNRREMMKNIKTIIIDEVSMLRPDVLDGIHWTLLKNGVNGGLLSKQVILIGDMKQLPVIIDDNTRSVLDLTHKGVSFFDANIYSELNVFDIELDEILRQSDPDFINALNIIRDGGKSDYFKQFVSNEPIGIIVAPHNSTVDMYNEYGLRSQEGELIELNAIISGNAKTDEFNLDPVIRVKNGCKIMYLANARGTPLINGTLGTFVVNEEGDYFIRVNETNYQLEQKKFSKVKYEWNNDKRCLELNVVGEITQYPFRLAYALSIHKSQGLTFDELTVDLKRPCFAKGQLYVALSRVKTPEGLRIIIK